MKEKQRKDDQNLTRLSSSRRTRVAAFVVMCLLSGTATPYEVNTHMAITGLAIEKSTNLEAFLSATALSRTTYEDGFFEDAENAFGELIRIPGRTAKDLIKAGAVLEDDDWRFFNHFLDPTNDNGLDLPLFSPRPNARDWANGNQNYSWSRALDYFELGFTSPGLATRNQNQELLFRTLGHVMHLVQDVAQPSHTRNDAHSNSVLPDGESRLELWGREDLTIGNFDAVVSSTVDATQPFYSGFLTDYFNSMATLSNSRFFSDDTIFRDYPSPSVASTFRQQSVVAGIQQDFVVSTSDNVRLARAVSGICDYLVVSAFCESVGLDSANFTLDSADDVVVRDNANALVPEAAARSAGLLNHFFRGKLQVTVNQDNNIEIRNISAGPPVVNSAADVTFGSGSWSFYYEAADGQTVIEVTPTQPVNITPLPLDAPAIVDAGIVAQLDAASSTQLPENQRFTGRAFVVFRGTIGQEEGVAVGYFSLLPVYFSATDGVGPGVYRLDGSTVTEVYSSSRSYIYGVSATLEGDIYTAESDTAGSGELLLNGNVIYSFSGVPEGDEIVDVDVAPNGDVYFSQQNLGIYRRTPEGAVIQVYNLPAGEEIWGASSDQFGDIYATRTTYAMGGGSEILRNGVSIRRFRDRSFFDIDASANGDSVFIEGFPGTVWKRPANGPSVILQTVPDDYCLTVLRSIENVGGDIFSSAIVRGATSDNFGNVYWAIDCSVFSSTATTTTEWAWAEIVMNGAPVYRPTISRWVNDVRQTSGIIRIMDIDLATDLGNSSPGTIP